MPATEYLENVAENVVLNRVTLGVMYFRAPFTGTLKSVTLYRSATGGISGVWYFNLRQNATALFSGSGRLAFSLGVESDDVSALSEAVTEGDVFQLDLEQNGTGTITGHLTLCLEFETPGGLPAGGTTGQVLAKNSGTDYDTTWVDGGTLDSLSDVTITTPTTGQVLTYDGSVWKNDTGGGGGGGGSVEMFSPDCPYSTPGSYDDEFNAGSLDAKWTSFLTAGNAPTFDHTSTPNHIGIKGTTDGTLSGITQSITPSGDFVIGCKVFAPAVLDTYKRPRGGLVIYDASGLLVFGFVRNGNGRYLSLYKTNDASIFYSATKVNDRDIWGGSTYSDYLTPTQVYLRIKYTHSSKSCVFEYSFDGMNWNDFYTYNTYGSGAATKIGIAVDKLNSSSNTMCYFDWFRVMQGSVFGRNYSVT